MLTVQFSPCRLMEYSDPHQFEQRVVKWLLLREAENAVLLGTMHDILRSFGTGGPRARLFALEDDGAVTGAAVLGVDGTLFLTWMTQPMLRVLADGLAQRRCQMASVYGPAHDSWRFAQIWARMTGREWHMGPEERIYQLMSLKHSTHASGRLELAASAHRDLVLPWMESFIRDTGYPDPRADFLADVLIRQRQLYVWMDPQPVSMAAWVMPTQHGACINFVFTPPELRGRGYGKSVVSALAQQMLGSGLEFCFIFTGTSDRLTNSLYQAIGARTICEFMRCAITAPVPQQSFLASPALAL